MKRCTHCGVDKPLSEFRRRGKCRQCLAAIRKAYGRTERGKQVKRAGVLRREYGVSEEQYLELHAKQAGLCAICWQPETKLIPGKAPLRLSVDHDHVTGKVRGLLCSACNVGLGSFKDDPELLQAAGLYLLGERAKVVA